MKIAGVMKTAPERLKLEEEVVMNLSLVSVLKLAISVNSARMLYHCSCILFTNFYFGVVSLVYCEISIKCSI